MSFLIISIRSWTVNSACFLGLCPIATMNFSNIVQPRVMTSRCPFVRGSNVPGKIAILGVSLIYLL